MVSRTETTDQIRFKILSWFCERNRSALGIGGDKISEVQKEIKKAHGYKRQVVNEHVTYLVDYEYINVEVTKVQAPARGGGGTLRESITKSYRISAKGMDFIAGKSAFSPKERYSGINLTAIGSTVLLGDGNVVNAQYRDVHQELDRMAKLVGDSKELNDAKKLDISADIETIKDQLAKANPEKGILTRAWNGIKEGVVGATLVDYAAKIGTMLSGLSLL